MVTAARLQLERRLSFPVIALLLCQCRDADPPAQILGCTPGDLLF